MTFTAVLIPGMAAVAFAVIDHFQLSRIKRGGQALVNFVGDAHFFLPGGKNLPPPLFYFRSLRLNCCLRVEKTRSQG